ncbi:MAG: hypothetical protein RR219_09765, partial [Clostridiales bacterium]
VRSRRHYLHGYRGYIRGDDVMVRGLHPDVKKAFDKLQQELLVRMASDFTDEKETEIYGMCGDIIANVEDLINKALKNR